VGKKSWEDQVTDNVNGHTKNLENVFERLDTLEAQIQKLLATPRTPKTTRDLDAIKGLEESG